MVLNVETTRLFQQLGSFHGAESHNHALLDTQSSYICTSVHGADIIAGLRFVRLSSLVPSAAALKRLI